MADIKTEIGGFLLEWDVEKEKLNRRKHGISFETAGRIFLDTKRIEYYDVLHSMDEDRFVTIGIVDGLLSVVYTERENDVLRLISARKATEKERRAYERRSF
ncbi:BrnT family toxin [Selenomonas massiliensis]|uniref:BrnT family toxin n=1 Tax=Selenomonas massiliensis TaxID=2058293 RepID=UPI000D0FD862|nr:BrnT family toxin [Selenomonas massiliensis]